MPGHLQSCFWSFHLCIMTAIVYETCKTFKKICFLTTAESRARAKIRPVIYI